MKRIHPGTMGGQRAETRRQRMSQMSGNYRGKRRNGKRSDMRLERRNRSRRVDGWGREGCREEGKEKDGNSYESRLSLQPGKYLALLRAGTVHSDRSCWVLPGWWSSFPKGQTIFSSDIPSLVPWQWSLWPEMTRLVSVPWVTRGPQTKGVVAEAVEATRGGKECAEGEEERGPRWKRV